ncbi:MAG: fibronectin type III domain-containing protein [Candidatus Paceibacterota bacterium]
MRIVNKKIQFRSLWIIFLSVSLVGLLSVSSWFGTDSVFGAIETENLDPNGDGTTTEWTPASGTDNYLMVDDGDRDGTTPSTATYVESTSSANTLYTDDYQMTTVVLDGADKVTVFVNAEKTAGGGGNELSASVLTGGTWEDPVLLTNAVEFGQQWFSAEFVGAVTQSDIDDLQVRVTWVGQTSPGNNQTARVYAVYAELEYELSEPTVTTSTATSTTHNSTTLRGDLTSMGEESSVDLFFEWREKGEATWNETTKETGVSATTSYDFDLSSLSASTTHEYRAAVEWSSGTASSTGSTVEFTTDPPVAPDAPTGLSASTTNHYTIDLSWTAPADDGGADITGYAIQQRSPAGSGSWTTLVADTGTTATSYSDDALEPETEYEYQVAAINSVGTGSYSTAASSTTSALPSGVPSAPTSTVATELSSTSIVVTWDLPAEGTPITSYIVERESPIGGGWISLGDTGTTTRSYTDTGLSGNTQYNYRVRAVNDTGTGPVSNEADATTEAPFAPDAPTSLSATATSTSQIDLAWTAPESDGGAAITGYKIERESPSGNGFSTLVADTESTDTTYSNTGLTSNTQYNYRVFAINSVGASLASNQDAATTSKASPSISTSAADNLADTTATLNGDVVSAGDFTTFDLFFEYRVKDSGDSFTTTATQTATTSGTFDQAVSSLTAGETYEYRAVIQWENDGTQELKGDLVEFTTYTVPDAPTSLTATAASATRIDLSWTAPSDNGGTALTGYTIERESPSGNGFSTLVADTESTDTTYADTGLTASTEYNYRVLAINTIGTSTASSAASATTSAAPSDDEEEDQGSVSGGGGGGGSGSPSSTDDTDDTSPYTPMPPFFFPESEPEPTPTSDDPAPTPPADDSPQEEQPDESSPTPPSDTDPSPSAPSSARGEAGAGSAAGRVLSEAVSQIAQSAAVVRDTVSQTRTRVREVFETPGGSVTTKTVATAGVLAGGAATLSTLFLSPLTVGEIVFIPLRLWALLLTLLGIKRKHRPWGTVYDSVTKQPLDPAYVVLENEQGEELQTSITDLDGRYGFSAPPGRYRIKANKTNYTFPSQKMAGKHSDELYADLYFGEIIETTRDGEAITRNIPLDPEKFDWNEFAKRDQKIMRFYSKFDTLKAKLTNLFFNLGLVIALLALWVAPQPYNIIIFVLYVALILMRILGFKPKTLGRLIEKETGTPIPFAIIRVFQATTGHEYITRVTDKRGNFYILVPNGSYYLTVDRKNPDESYTTIKTTDVFSVTNGIVAGEVLV